MEKEYNQEIGETYEEWRRRILLGIVTKNVKLEWLEACILLGMPWDTAKAQEMANKFRQEEVAKEEAMAKSEEELAAYPQWDALDEKTAKMERAKMQFQDQKREYRKELRKFARAEHLMDEVKKACANTKPVLIADTAKTPSRSEIGDNEGVLLLSDWHKGQVSSNHWNTYNDVVFKKRIQELLEQTISYGKLHEIHTLHVMILGDLINGLIHISTRINNEENVIKQTIQAAEMLSDMLNELSRYFDVNVYFARGNHDRVSANKKESIDGESFFDLLQYYVTARIDEMHPTLHVMTNEIDPEIIRAEVAGHVCYGVHGHKDKVNMVAKNLTTFMHEIPDFIFMGHFHSAAEQEVNGIEVVVNASMCGTDDFAVSLRRNSQPSQKLMIINPRGRLCTYNIAVDD